MTEVAYRYLKPSAVMEHGADRMVELSTAGGRSDNPHFFSGFAEQPLLTARAMLAVAEVARTRYFDPGAATRSRDPVVTANEDVLRFESFSACNGVYARFDLDGSAVDGEFRDWGTTNVDFNPPMRSALSRIGDREPLRLSVGTDEVAVETLDAQVVERRVPLPSRWVRGFAEVSVVAADMVLVNDVAEGPARRILRDIPRIRSTGPTWLVWTPGGVRATSVGSDEAVCVAGPERLRAIGRLVPLVRRLRVYAPPPQHRLGIGGRRPTERAAHASAWELIFDGGRLVLALSPEIYRGFSGEGGILMALAAADPQNVEKAGEVLHGQSTVDIDGLAEALSTHRTAAWATARALGGAGRMGYDLARTAYFHRDLPFDRSAVDELQPRLIEAKALIEAGAVAVGGGGYVVHSGATKYLVRLGEDGARCTCPWFAKHRGERGPCKHVVAVELSRSGAVV